jgi:DNA-binding NtrC family response regulator
LSSPSGKIHALHVASPHGGARFALPFGVVTLGRGAESTIALDDPRVSRAHAALHIGDGISVTDLGSVNGTVVDGERLPPHDARRLTLGQAFRIGGTTLVVDLAPLPQREVCHPASFEALAQHLGALPPSARTGPGLTVLTVRVARQSKRLPIEAVIDSVLGPGDWMLRLDDDTWLVGANHVRSAGERSAEHVVLRALVGWGIVAGVEARVIEWERVIAADSELLALLSFEAPLTLRRGQVLLLDPVMKELERTVMRVAQVNLNVLVLGETGAGKDVIASMLHEFSARSSQPFVGLNCASLPDQLLESELFGYERGAFTGAIKSKPGLLEAADGGTLFLDEIGDLPAPLQAKLLRVIESRELTRLGGVTPRTVDVRLVAATNCDLETSVAAGRFRRDLYYRLNGVSLRVPPLRERPGEIEPLARLFQESACDRFGSTSVPFSAAALQAMTLHSWPGNVRELRNAVERAVVLAEHAIEPEHLGLASAPSPHTLFPADSSAGASQRFWDGTPELGPDAAERERIARALEACAGNQSRAAKLLQVPRRTLIRRIAQLGLPRPRV